jgi:hypothetical protein
MWSPFLPGLEGDGTGDLPGIIGRLPYLRDLGLDAIWLSPIFPSPMADFGYGISDYAGVDPIFGTLNDFDLLAVRHCKRRSGHARSHLQTSSSRWSTQGLRSPGQASADRVARPAELLSEIAFCCG